MHGTGYIKFLSALLRETIVGIIRYCAMVTSPTGKGVIAMGGYSSGGRSKAMFELSQSMEWTRLEQTLQIEH